ncbi:MAG: GNAT family N-acetyltransferase [Candidatus Delongbacteria bacterium]|nr:GNAT family N-acetyltransferase [Candidatus Delongbacteria bacterium]
MSAYRLDQIAAKQYKLQAEEAELLAAPAWAEILELLFPESMVYLAFYKGDEPLAVLFLQQRRRLGVAQIHTPLLTPWTAVTWQQPRSGHDLRRHHLHLTATLAAWTQRHYHQAAFKFAPTAPDIRSFQWAGWSSRWRYSYQLEGSREADAALRKKLRRLPDLAVTVEEPTPVLGEVITAALAEHNFTNLPPDLLFRWIRELVAAGLAHCLVARHDGQVVALQLLLERGSWRGLWLQLTLPRQRAATPGTHLVEAILQTNEGYTLDFLGADDPGIDEHKSAFGGELTCYPEVLWFRNGWLRSYYFRRHRSGHRGR